MSFSDDPTAGEPAVPEAGRRTLKRTDEIVEAIKRTIVTEGLKPGDRLPQEHELIRQFAASKGTVREALKALETQGLIRMRTGPGGGAFVKLVSEAQAMSLLSNYLFAKELTIADIYQLRKALEPLAAVSAMDHIDAEGFERLEAIIAIYDHEPRDAEERWNQRMAELDFHAVVAEYADNPLLSFQCRFLQRLLKDLTVCRDIYRNPKPVLRRRGIEYQRALIAAMKAEKREEVHRIMHDHMVHAQHQMLSLEAELATRFIDAI